MKTLKYILTTLVAGLLLISASNVIAQEDPPPFVMEWGELATGALAPGTFYQPKDIGLGPNEEIYVVDHTRVQRFDPTTCTPTSCLPTHMWGFQGFGWDGFQVPWAIDVAADGRVYVADTYNHLVKYFMPDGTCPRINEMGECVNWFPGDASQVQPYGSLVQPSELAINLEGLIYVPRYAYFKIYDLEGELQVDTPPNNTERKFNRIAFGSNGEIYATVFSTIYKFNADGTLFDPASPVWASAPEWQAGYYGIAVGPEGEVYVTESLRFHRIDKYDAEGNLVAQWGEYGTGPGQFNSPRSIVLSDDGQTIYVADTYNHRIQMFGYATNTVPVANAGADQAIHVGSLVMLDGSASSDPEGDYPLTYQWTLWFGNSDVTGLLSYANIVDPSFTADQLGYDYRAELIVTDSEGLNSAPDDVVISTMNASPVADAGEDQLINLVGTLVTLDGSQSYDEDGDFFTYVWTLVQRPSASNAALSDPFSSNPGFVADINGEYEITLIVSDFYADSDPDSVLISFNNVAPVADAGGNQAVMVGETVTLSGGGSYDANNDPLTFQWSFVSLPTGSGATLNYDTNEVAYFEADVTGTFVVSLVVNDGIVSNSDNITIVSTVSQGQIIAKLQYIMDVINSLPTEVLKNRKMAKPLTNKLNAVISMVDDGEFEQAYDKLINDVPRKTDGCFETGVPDKNDWIMTCEAQDEIYPLIMQTTELLESLISG